MIRKETLALSRDEFAAGRRQIIADNDEALRPHVAEALGRLGLPQWQYQIVAAALDIFDVTARSEVDAWTPVLDDMRDAFEAELNEALLQTKTAANRDAQTDTITRWVSVMAHNAGIEAATTADTSSDVGLEWVTMGDAEVRGPHREAAGQTVPTGHQFEVGGEKMYYPGQPVGDPSNWINCRCVARPTMLNSEFTAESLTASAAEPFTTAVIVALPSENDPVTAASSESDGAHCTLLFLGDTANLDRDALAAALEGFITRGEVGVMVENVSGSATLGKDSADVVLIDGNSLTQIRNGLLEDNTIVAAYQSVEQFPNFIPHVTLGYPETPRARNYRGDQITFDRLALWFGEDRTAIYPLGETIMDPDQTKQPTEAVHPEDPGFTKEMADGLTEALAATPEGPLAAAPAQKPAEQAPAPAGGSDLRPWHGVLAPEGAPSGDNRGFAERALTTRDLPLPLKAMFTDDEGHKGSVVVGRIDEVFRDGGLIKAKGVWDNTPEAEKASGMIDRKMWRGVSVDLDAAEGEMVEASDGGEPSIEFSKGRISSATLCAIPAFAEAFVRNGTWEEFVNEPMPTGAMVDIPDWPSVALVASAAPVISADYFRNPMLEGPTPVTLGEDGHIFGHLAEWGTCHIGYDVCVTPPSSSMDYAYFLTGQVFTDAGPVPVGQLTVGGGHAPDGVSVRAAIAHYDNVGTAVADIAVGEDAHGIWFSGKVRPWATEQQLHELFAAGPSGDWRGVRARGQESLELVAAHAVNVQGFPVPRARFAVDGGRQVSLVAAGMPKRPELSAEQRLESVNTIKASIRSLRFADIKKQFTSTKGS